MLQPLLRLIASRPELLADHAAAYAELAASEWDSAIRAALRRVTLGLIAFLGVLIGVVLAGVAGLLCAVLPIEHMSHPLLLIAIPAAPLVVAAMAGLSLALLPREPAFADIKRQLQADFAMLKAAARP
jgi:MFS family permease